MPIVGALEAHAGAQFDAAGASRLLPTTHLLLAGIATLAITLASSLLHWSDRWRAVLMPGLLGLAAVVATLAIGEGPDGQLSYYPKKLSFHAMALLVPLVGFWFAAVLEILGRAVVPKAVWLAPALGVISIFVVADYVGYLRTYQQLADGEPGIGMVEAQRLIDATDRLGELPRDTVVAVVGSGTPYHDRQLTGIVASSLSRPGPADFGLYDPPGLQERCDFLAEFPSLVVIDVGASPTDLGCLALHPDLRVVRP